MSRNATLGTYIIFPGRRITIIFHNGYPRTLILLRLGSAEYRYILVVYKIVKSKSPLQMKSLQIYLSIYRYGYKGFNIYIKFIDQVDPQDM